VTDDLRGQYPDAEISVVELTEMWADGNVVSFYLPPKERPTDAPTVQSETT